MKIAVSCLFLTPNERFFDDTEKVNGNAEPHIGCSSFYCFYSGGSLNAQNF